jgi:hypothetical protein
MNKNWEGEPALNATSCSQTARPHRERAQFS